MRQADGTLLYLHGDHLGSTSLVTKADGTILSDQGYRAYGRYRRGGALPTDHRFTGQKLDATGLYYYNARYYDPEIGQFISPDPLVPDPSNLFAYNRYLYVAGNPLRLTDSSGHFWETVADVVSVGYDVYDIYQNGLTWSSGSALVVDVAGAAIPFVPSAGTCVRWCDDAWQYGSKAVGWVGDKADEGWQAAKNLVGMGDEAAQYGDEAASAAKAGADCLTNSFSAETLVMTPSGAKPIAELTEGDLVLAYNEATGKIGAYPIIDTISHIDPEIVLLTIDGETLETTAEHPFYELQSAPWLAAGQTEGRWTNALELKAGDLVWKADGTSNAVQSVEVAQVPQRMYNLTVAEAHTFFVGKQQWLVHNCDFSVVRYGDKVSGANNHHGIMDAWASANVPGYVSRASGAPTVQMSTEAHAKTTAVFRQWLTENYGNPVGVKVDWSKHSRQEIYNLAERMFDAAGTPHAVRTRYYTALDSYLQTGKWE